MAVRGQLTELAYQTVKQRLLTGTYRAGDRISVEDLAIEFGTSRQPIMDALKRLATGYYLEIIPQVGVRVAVPKRQDVFDFHRSLAATEAVCAELAAERADKKGAAKLCDINEQIGLLLSDEFNDVERALRYRALNREFHRQLTTLAQSKNISSISDYMWDRNDFFMSSTFEVKVLMERLRTAYEEHNSICEAVAANDPESARRATLTHLLAFTQRAEIDG
ncbi:MAG: DNA-binding GntR family transcriptional regulator [Alphaproteobacteria bacterium]|jgi:DNA-binding GntR family transcriptional regulator